MANPPESLVLASSSPYRKELLERLRIPFRIVPADLDERSLPGETALSLVRRLSEDKARAGADTEGDVLVIGSDQVAACDNRLLGKPGSAQKAEEQLRFTSGKHIVFFTGVAVWRPSQNRCSFAMTPTEVAMRKLTEAEIKAYVAQDEPFDCAGSFKWESLGISLFTGTTSPDPTALQGLPLIALCDLLRSEGYCIP